MEIESLAGRIRCEKNPAMASVNARSPRLARGATGAVQNSRRLVERAGNVREGVPIFSKDDERLGDSADQPADRRQLGFRAPRRRPLRRRSMSGGASPDRILQCETACHARRSSSAFELAMGIEGSGAAPA